MQTDIAAHARLELHDLMDKLGDRLLYSDTDSVVFVSKVFVTRALSRRSDG